jgi:hypothetical protein
VTATLYDGDETLEVVGESRYQDHLRWIVGDRGDWDEVAITAVLVPQPDNQYDRNAVQVQVEGGVVGYLSRDDAVDYARGIANLMSTKGTYVALSGVICGGPSRMLGVFLNHDPADFGLGTPSKGRDAVRSGNMRTGWSEAWLRDADDDDYDLSWFDALPDADRPAIAMLRELLDSDPDPIDRHFQFSELESRLYRSRDLYDTALDEYDETCRRHDAEMEAICQQFKQKWGKVPLLDTYRQMAIRQQKSKDWPAVMWWAERGIGLYGPDAARQDAVEDLEKRRNRARAALAAAEANQAAPRPKAQSKPLTATVADATGEALPQQTGEIEILICEQCSNSFERIRVRGRKPKLCPTCRGT